MIIEGLWSSLLTALAQSKLPLQSSSLGVCFWPMRSRFDPRQEQKLKRLTILQCDVPDVIFTSHTQCPSPSSCASTVHKPPPPRTPLKPLTHEQPAQSTMLATLMLGGSFCGQACSPHLLEVSCHYSAAPV